MSSQVRSEKRPCRKDLDGTVYVLEAGDSQAVIWPAFGFNCLSWQIVHQGTVADLLWSEPGVFENGRPTRNGIPVLFPFPNRIRDGCFTWNGRDYQLPINGPGGRHAIHGFACFRPWRVADCGTREGEAWIRGVFHGSKDAPECRDLWPSDYVLEIEYALSSLQLRIDITVKNPDAVPLPFGVGFHPYFRFSLETSHFTIESKDAGVERWVLEDCLPTGELVGLDGFHRLLTDSDAWPPAGEQRNKLQWDDAYRVGQSRAGRFALHLADPSRDLRLAVEVSEDFRDLVIFTPPHRQAVCLEPYTCMTDAINLAGKGIETGLLVLTPSGEWRDSIRMKT